MAAAKRDSFDDLDAFFSAAASSDPNAIEQAAQDIAGRHQTERHKTSHTITSTSKQSATKDTTTGHEPEATTYYFSDGEDTEDLDGKFIAIDPEKITGSQVSREPFVLVPAHVHTMLPWWAWVSIGIGLAMLIAGVVIMPGVTLNRLTARLDDSNPVAAQSVMRQLVIQGDEQTIQKLYEFASSSENSMSGRLRAVDTLGLIHTPEADRALLRLELAGSTTSQVRDAAIAARKQREAAKSRAVPR